MRTRIGALILTFTLGTVSTGRAAEKPVEFPEGWTLNKGVKDCELKVVKDAARAWDGDTCVFVRGHLMSGPVHVSGGDEIEITFRARAPEGGTVYCKAYTYSRAPGGRLAYNGGLPGFSGKAGPEWTEVSGKLDVPAALKYSGKPVHAVRVVLASDTGAYFDAPSVSHVKTGAFKSAEYARYEAKGRLERRGNHFADAIEAFSKALRFAKTESERELILDQIEQTRTLEKISRTTAKAVGLFDRADALTRDRRYGQARAEYEAMKGMSDRDYLREIALFNIAELHRLEKDYASAHKAYREILALPDLTAYYRIDAAFREATVYLEQGDCAGARELYQTIVDTDGALEHHMFRARLLSADTYLRARRYGRARALYETLLREQERSAFPHESLRLDLIDRLEAIDGLADGQELTSRQAKRAEWVNRPAYGIYVSVQGKDDNPGTKDEPFASIQRARDEVRSIKAGKGMPKGGIVVYLRGGKYLVSDTLAFGPDDSGTPDGPVVYRSYPGERARIIGGRQLTTVKPLTDPEVLRRLPEEARGKVWVADLKRAGITDYGQLLNRGTSLRCFQPSAMEAFFNTKPLRLSRWPKQGWEKVAELVSPEGDGRKGNTNIAKGRFVYSGDRPDRWTEDHDIWTAGYYYREWDKLHTSIESIDTENKVIALAKDTRWRPSQLPYHVPIIRDAPYHCYNILSELSVPGEFYIDRSAGKLYFYPPEAIEGSELIVSTLDGCLVKLDNVSNMVLFGLTLEVTRRDAIQICGGRNNLIAGSTVRNAGVLGVLIDGGWRHGVVGCDIHDTGEGGVRLKGGDTEKLVPGGHVVENNHICRFNRFSHGAGRFGISMAGTGNRAAHNLLYDASYIALSFTGNDHVIEYNEIYDVMHEGKDGGAIYNHNGQAYLRGRGNVVRYNFIHHITGHSSPTKPSLIAGITIDGFNGGVTMEGNVFYRNTQRAIFSHGPDTRLENNWFIEGNQSILMSRRLLLDHTRVSTLLRTVERLLREVNYKQPPWSYRYPQLVAELEDTLPLGKTENNVVERNVNWGGQFLIIPLAVKTKRSVIRNNWERGDPLFMNPERMDFRIRPGSPAYGVAGVEPVPFERIGTYEDPLRAVWPVKRAPAGKYYVAEKAQEKPGEQHDTDATVHRFPPLKRVSEPRVYEVRRRTSPITVDGRLHKAEWSPARALPIREHHKTRRAQEGAESRAWLLFDDECLYLGIENCPDPMREGLTGTRPGRLNEVTLEGVFSERTSWWEEGLSIGPLYTFSGFVDGAVKVHDLYGMPSEAARELGGRIAYASAVIDAENGHWTAEWEIPFSALSICIDNVSTLRFNIGGPKRAGWFAWVATGGSLWRVDNAGSLRFVK